MPLSCVLTYCWVGPVQAELARIREASAEKNRAVRVRDELNRIRLAGRTVDGAH